MKPAPDASVVRPTAASAVSSAYCVAVCSAVAAQRRQIGDEDHRADRAGEVLDDDGDGQRRHAGADPGQPGEDEVREHLHDAADPQRGGERHAARDGAAGEAADQRAPQGRRP